MSRLTHMIVQAGAEDEQQRCWAGRLLCFLCGSSGNTHHRWDARWELVFFPWELPGFLLHAWWFMPALFIENDDDLVIVNHYYPIAFEILREERCSELHQLQSVVSLACARLLYTSLENYFFLEWNQPRIVGLGQDGQDIPIWTTWIQVLAILETVAFTLLADLQFPTKASKGSSFS